jgi:site-specific recombinase
MHLLDQLGKIGQKEIVRNSSASVRLLISSSGAGLITAGTVLLKMTILHSPLTMLLGGFLIALNYVGSFLSMQLFGFRLATKQSALIGTALGKTAQHLFREEVRYSVRTQLLSALGNFGWVVIAVLVFHWLFQFRTGEAFLDPAAARSALESLHPWRSGTLCYAAFTGGILWFCTILAGAVANRFEPFSKRTVATVFNIGLGAALAYVPLLGRSLGLPLDIRHFTLSSGMIAVAAASLGFHQALRAGLLEAFLGVLGIGCLNFSVSFALAFLTSSMKSHVKGPPAIGPILALGE